MVICFALHNHRKDILSTFLTRGKVSEKYRRYKQFTHNKYHITHNYAATYMDICVSYTQILR